MKNWENALKKLAILTALAFGMAAAGCAHGVSRPDDDRTLAMLREGGNLIVMRHATSPSGQQATVGMTEGCELQPGRGLSSQGFFEARFIGEWLSANGTKIDKTYTSDMCRAYDTARLVAAAGNGPVIPRAEMKSDDPVVTDKFKKELTDELAAAPRSNILLVTHSNITPLYWSEPLNGEEETPSGRLHVIRKVTGPDGQELGRTVARLDFNAKVTVRPKVLDPDAAATQP